MVLLLPLLAGLAAAVPRSPSSSGTPTPTPSLLPTCQPNGQLPAQTPIDFHFGGNVRKYYIAAEEVDWDYAPSGWDNWLSVPVDKSPRADDAGYNDVPSLGTKWRKAMYRGYTDATFSKRTPQPAWQGLQGPTIRAEVGDMVEILFVNRMPTHYASMHSMGLAYTKNNEGAIYERSNMTVTGDAVPPGGCWVYKWVAPESAAPNHGEPATMHGYHSYVSIQEDLNAGLVGPQMTYQRGKMTETLARYREFPVLLQGIDESKSFLAAENARRAGKNVSVDYQSTFAELMKYGNESVWRPQMTSLMSAKFDDAPEFYAMNGLVLGNLPTFEMCLNDQVIWYVYGTFSSLAPKYRTYTNNNRPRRRPSLLPHARQCLYPQRQQDDYDGYASISLSLSMNLANKTRRHPRHHGHPVHERYRRRKVAGHLPYQ